MDNNTSTQANLIDKKITSDIEKSQSSHRQKDQFDENKERERVANAKFLTEAHRKNSMAVIEAIIESKKRPINWDEELKRLEYNSKDH